MPHTRTQDSEIYYETHGDPADRPVVLIEGLGAQLIGWREAFVDILTARGLFVIRLDNRDVGLSHKVAEGGYRVDDMANDVFSVLDALGLKSAQIVGQSMGGVIAQHMAMAQPDRVSSLILFYTMPAFDVSYFAPGAQDTVPLETASLSRDQKAR